jgi:hypothetical protein
MQTGGYCSPVCTALFGQCITCGRYLAQEELVNTHFCSDECARHYQFLKTMGPRPVIIASDQSTTDPDDVLI